MWKFLFLLTILVATRMQPQQSILGTLKNEDGVELPNAVVRNMTSGATTVTDRDGNFFISAAPQEELRIMKENYERFSIKLSNQNFSESLNVILKILPHEIAEVEIKYKPTGNLEQDLKHFGDRGKVKIMKEDVADYIAQKSDLSVMLAKPGEFVQPVGPGFSVGRVRDQWTDLDFMNFLIAELSNDYFVEDLGLKPLEIQPFIYYVFRDFERSRILKFGDPKPSDIAVFMARCERKIREFTHKKPLPSKIK